MYRPLDQAIIASMHIIDLRSDTVTQPTPEMRRAMAQAEVGDDVYGEDPTVNQLEELAAERMGKEAAMFVPSGTMGNLAAILTHCGRGDEVILGDQAHTFTSEAGGIAALGGVHPHPLRNAPDGTLALEDILGAIREDDPHYPRTRLICLENTHNRCYGAALSVAYTAAVGHLAHERGLKLHIDGARIFNAAIAQGVEARDLAAPADSITFCLSKGLCAPVGSVLCGPTDFIREARRTRKVLGGGMRQAGILAAAGIVALETMVDRLAEDHVNARRLAEGLANLPGITIELDRVQTNIVFFDLKPEVRMDAKEISAQLVERGVKVGVAGPRRFRAVTHYWVKAKDIDRALAAFSTVLRSAL